MQPLLPCQGDEGHGAENRKRAEHSFGKEEGQEVKMKGKAAPFPNSADFFGSERARLPSGQHNEEENEELSPKNKKPLALCNQAQPRSDGTQRGHRHKKT